MPNPSQTSHLRIIGGIWRGRKVSFKPSPELRPTPDRVRETLFNWLQGKVSGRRSLELFAGSGILSLEALSRGAEASTLVDTAKTQTQHFQTICSAFQIEPAQCQVHVRDAFKLIQTKPEKPYHLIFVDPPFDTDRYLDIVPSLLKNDFLAPDGFVYLEAPSADVIAKVAQQGLTLYRQKRAGQVHYALLTR
ncbi:16S rRNA (guanine(966)-N(2))-methyltransferase RsmD [Pseudomonadales bacterium]|nr:16S rRNA (guanine(966)-N(2))-methyltransferase RsmD [Pseudomonadales bacterium]